ncbi:U11/U12 small nuclear ribonucleoprotein 48 kDa protein isoform X1 [Astyanax mexicanus]|uniref:U11/U12 small nuclear ribonucleoprotein 48 kDa protein isoform X1 n=1 Tax=Astyanax mexicanus TaxID=7994 RepID=A0A8T2LZC9_ASTMX|nr:U11/U12 small nuclear ribonucleoprotein 48 kDa protein isoform X1 [Astyanax mexicanus]
MSAGFSPELLEERLRSLQELTEFTESCRTQLTEVFSALDWEPNWGTDSREQMEVCSFDANHRVPSRSMEKHKAVCQLVQLGYSREEQAEMYDPSVCYEGTNISSIKLDKHEQHQVILQAQAGAPAVSSAGIYCQGDYSTEPADVPQNYKRTTCDLTVADRLALYDHLVQKAKQQSAQAQSSSNEDLYVDLVSKLNKDEAQNAPKSHLEVLAEMRDYRRRRQSYRAKNVHITKKSYTEVIREVIDVHSGELAKLWQEERKEESKTSQHFHRKQSGEGRSASVDSRTSSREENSSRYKHHWKRSREKDSKSRKRDSHSPEEKHHKKKKKKKSKS